MSSVLQFLQWIALSGVLVILAYVDRLYRELGHITSGPVRENLDEFTGRIERRLSSNRRRGASSFSMLVRLWLALTAVAAAHDIFQGSGTRAEMAAELVFLLGAEVVIGMHFLPALLVVRTRSRWLIPLVPFLRLLVLLILPVEATLHFFGNMLRLAEEEESPAAADNQEAIEAFVEQATEEGIIEHDEARLIEQVVEFGDKRVSVLMTPRPDIVAIRATASLEELRRLLVEKKHSRILVFENDLDDIIGVALARDILNFREQDAAQHTVRELVRPVLFVPETKLGSELLKEMQRKNQQMAICVDEYGSTAGIVTAEDLIEEIVGEMGDERRQPAPDVVREPSGSLVLRGSLPLGRLQELFGVEWDESLENEGATTVAGLMNRVAGHVPAAGETLEFGGILFDIVEANQRKVLRVRARRNPQVASPVAVPR
jgi:putative hemolysin